MIDNDLIYYIEYVRKERSVFEEPSYWEDRNGRRMFFTSAESAQKYIDKNIRENILYSCIWEIYPKEYIDKEEWKEREESKFLAGEYKPVPWQHEEWAKRDELKFHYPHISKDNERMIAFTETQIKGIRDVQTRMKPGKYLEKHCSGFI